MCLNIIVRTTQRRLTVNKLLAILLAAVAFTANAQKITGAGATFPAPVYSKWAEQYNKATGVQINYSAIGSSGGIKQIDAKTVDFGATDDPRKAEEVTTNGQFQFPTVIGGVVPVVNLAGIEAGKLVLDGKTLADIFASKITKWNDPAIVKLNPGIKLPADDITLVVRSDGSGTTAVFTDYLSRVNSDFKSTIGAGKAVKWGANVAGGKGNAGVAANVKQIAGAIGYVEYAFAKQGKMVHVAMLHKGKVVQPSADAFAEAALGADWNTPGMAVNLNDQSKGWPITAATFILVYKEGNDNTQNVLKFFDWTFANGDKLALELDYVPLPKDVQNKIRAEWAKNIK